MKLNRFETLLMNNPVRAYVQRSYEAPRLERLAPKPLAGAETLVIGCGRGVDVEIAFDLYRVSSVVAIDVDPAQVRRAEKLIGERYGGRLKLEAADASALSFESGRFDLVLDFGIIHHIPEWQKAVREVSRVLKSGGQFLFEEIPGAKLNSFLYRLAAEHPRENRFEKEDFKTVCESNGLVVGGRMETFFGFFRGAALKTA